MWQAINESLSGLCSSAFWDTDLTWNSSDPDFTLCFERTMLVWIPCAFLWLSLPLEIYLLLRSKAFNIPFNSYNISKLVIIVILMACVLVDVFQYVFPSGVVVVADIVTSAIKLLTMGIFFGLTYANIKYGIRSSGVLFIFSLLLAVSGMPQFRKELRSFGSQNDENGYLDNVTYSIYYIAILLVLFLNCFADASPAVYTYPLGQNACPENSSSFLSKILFTWCDMFVWKGYRKTLSNDDVWDLDYDMKTAHTVQKFETKWNHIADRLRGKADTIIRYKKREPVSMAFKAREYSKKLSVLHPLWDAFGMYLVLGVIFRILHGLLEFASPFVLRLIILWVGDKEEYFWHGYVYAVLLLLIAFVQAFLFVTHLRLMDHVGLRIRTTLMTVIYKKALRITNGARKDFTLGEIVNLMAVDAQRFVELMTYIPLVVAIPVEICLTIYFLWNILGPSVLAGLAVLILLTPVHGMICAKVERLQVKQMQRKDERVKLINEILSGIKVLKMYAWEPNFETHVARIRDKEISILTNAAYLDVGSTFVCDCAPFLVSLVTFAVFVLSSEDNVLDAQTAFVSLSLFNILKAPLLLLPYLTTTLAQVLAAVTRVNKFLNSEELDENSVTHERLPEAILIENGHFSWDSYRGPSILSNINVKIRPGRLVAVVGSVGSGKTSLLNAILGEMYRQSGHVNTTGKLGYVPQQAWIRSATFKDNITFGEPMNQTLYDKIIEACALNADLKILPGGDETEIGEKGINLSGGQKQRISLARALYSGADIYLLDDPLSAVDSHVGKHIFDQVIGPKGVLKNKTRILVTHHLTYLSQVDLIIVLQDGVISESGSFNELLEKGGDFAEFLINYHTSEENDYSEDEEDAAVKEEILRRMSKTSETSVRSRMRKQSRAISEYELKVTKTKVIEHKLIENERTETGHIKWKVYSHYLKAVGPLLIIISLSMNVLFQTFQVASSYWLNIWSGDKNIVMAKQYLYIGVYALLGLGQGVSIIAQAIATYLGLLKAANRIHSFLLNAVLHWPTIAFDRIPSGRIINRFGYDIDVLDNFLPRNAMQTLVNTALMISIFLVISCSIPLFLTVILPGLVLIHLFQRSYIMTSRQLMRFDSVSRSPIYTHFGEAISGVQSIRAYDLCPKFIQMSERMVDFNLKNSYSYLLTRRWITLRLQLVGGLLVFFSALFAVLGRNNVTPGLVGLTMGYALQVSNRIYVWIRSFSEVEMNIVAVERVKQYEEIKHEAAWYTPEDDLLVPKNWPHRGEVVFKDFRMRYHEGLEPVLRDVSFNVRSCEKVGIVGRTGAGKSSLTLSLLRMIEATGGRILIDGIDIAKIGLHTLRGRLTIIPQDPVLFSGTLRMNLDPTEKHTDENIWRALELANLKKYVANLECTLDYRVTEGGSNFSTGQCQLICLARALLRKSKVLIMDEATAAVDFETDDLIQTTIRKEFKDSTVLTIAHRLNTILDYDRILVLDRGRIAEFDSPQRLLQSKNSIFYNLAATAGLVSNFDD